MRLDAGQYYFVGASATLLVLYLITNHSLLIDLQLGFAVGWLLGRTLPNAKLTNQVKEGGGDG